MQEFILMFKLKLFLILLIFPFSYLVYHLIGFENGVNAYFQKIKNLKYKENYQAELLNEIKMYKNKIKLLEEESIDLDYLEEKSFYLGNSPKDSHTILLK